MKRSTFAVAAAALLPAAAMAQATNAWQFEAALYGYFPSFGGSTTFPSSSGGSNINVDASTIIDNLKMVFMGSFEARNGKWGAYTDVMYMDIGGSKSSTREMNIGGVPLPGDVTADANQDLKGTVWTLAGTYRAIATPDATLDLMLGARMLDLQEKLRWNLSGNLGPIALPDRSGSVSASDRLWDGIIGVKGRLAFGDDKRWIAPYYLDVGTGNSDLTWQAMAGLGYSFKWGDVIGGWRYLDYNMKSGKPIESLNMNGPMVAVTFRW